MKMSEKGSTPMGPFIVWNKKCSLHFFVREVSAEECDRAAYGAAYADLNGLLVAKSRDQMVKAIADMPPLFPGKSFDGKQRIYSSREILHPSFAKLFTKCESSKLEEEFFIETAKGVRDNSEKIDALIGRYGSSGEEIAEFAASCPDAMFAVEPIVDWTMVRSLLSVVARLSGLIIEGAADPFRRGGFVYLDSRYLGIPIWGIPIKFNACERLHFNDRDYYTEEGASKFDPLFSSVRVVLPKRKVMQPVPGINKSFPATISLCGLSEDDEKIFFASQPIARDDFRKLFGKNRTTAEQKTEYLCIETGGDDVADVKRLVRRIVELFAGLKEKYPETGAARDYGWDCDYSNIFEEPGYRKTVCRSYASALMYALIYHPGKRYTVCALCGNAVLSNIRGTRKEYCSDACRVRATNIRKAAEEVHRDGDGSTQ